MKSFVFLICACFLLLCKQTPAVAVNCGNTNYVTQTTHICQNKSANQSFDNQYLLLFEDTDIEDEHNSIDELKINNFISFFNSNTIFLGYLKTNKFCLANLKICNGFSKNFSPFLAVSLPIYLILSIFRI